MENKVNQPIENEKNAVSDKDLKDVTGGWQGLEFGTFGATSQSMITKIKVIDGSVCPTCGGTIGVLAVKHDGVLCVRCEKDGDIILKPYSSDAVEVMM